MKITSAAFACAAAAAVAVGSVPASERGGRCPRGALPFVTPNPIAPAARAAIAREKAESRPQVTKAVVASSDLRGRGAQVKQCGQRTLGRTVVVYITLRKFLPSASLSERVSFVSRFRSGWRVWAIAH